MSRRPIVWAIVAVVALAVLLLVFPIFAPWTPLNCQHQDVDIMTGRLRFTRYLLFRKVSERVEDSSLSKVLPADMVTAAGPQWRRVNTFSPGFSSSPHYAFHGAINQICTLSDIWERSEVYGFPDDMKQRTALHILALWQHSEDDYLARDYILCLLYDLIDESKRKQILKALPTLEMPLVETNGSQVIRTVFYPNGEAMDRIHGFANAHGDFIRHGVWEQWRSDGTRTAYGYFENGERHGRTFVWDQDGKLIRIEGFNRGQLCEYEHDDLEQHPDYEIAQELLAPDRSKPRQ